MCWHTPPCPFPVASLTVLGDTRAHSGLRHWKTVHCTNKNLKVGFTKARKHRDMHGKYTTSHKYTHLQSEMKSSAKIQPCVLLLDVVCINSKLCAVFVWSCRCCIALSLSQHLFFGSSVNPPAPLTSIAHIKVCCFCVSVNEDFDGNMLWRISHNYSSRYHVYVRQHSLKGFGPISSGDCCALCTNLDAFDME